jgi:glucosyl-3-phosphoglycerate synthase
LAGEYAARRSLLETLAFPCGYGVEFALLVDTLQLHGLDAISQVEAGVRHHSHQSDEDLGAMAAEVMHAAQRRLAPSFATVGSRSHHSAFAEPATLIQFQHGENGIRPQPRELHVSERPPARLLSRRCNDPQYLAGQSVSIATESNATRRETSDAEGSCG